MAIDPSIPLQVQSPQFDMSRLMEMAQMGQKMKQQNALKAIMSDPSSMDPATGLPNAAAIQKIMGVDPQAGLKLVEETANIQQYLAQGKQKEAELYGPMIDKKKGELANLLGPRIKERGLEAAVAESRGDYTDAFADLKAQGVPDTWLSRMPKELTPALAQQFVAGAISPEKKADLEERDAAGKRAEKTEAEREKHDREMEKIALGKADAAASKGWTLLQDESGASFRTNANSGKSQKMGEDGEWEDIAKLPTNLRKPGTAPAGTLDMTDPADQDYVKAIANYRVKPPTSGRNLDYRKKVIEAALKENPDYAEGKYDQATKALKDFGTGPQGNTARSLNVSVSHLNTLRELGDALENGDVKLINAAKQAWQEQFGTPAPTNFNTAKSIVADEVAKGVIGGTTAQSDRETLAASLKSSGGPKIINGAIDTFQDLLGGQLGGLRDQYKRNTGANDFDEAFLSERTRKALKVGDKKSDADEKKDAKSGGTPQKHAVGDIVIQDGKKYRATAVDKDGKVTAADEVK